MIRGLTAWARRLIADRVATQTVVRHGRASKNRHHTKSGPGRMPYRRTER